MVASRLKNEILGLFARPRFERTSGHYYLIDGARGLAAITILFWHYQHFLQPDAGSMELARQPFYQPLILLYGYGLHAVELFWIISGFVFAAVYGARTADTRDFVVNRLARLYPLHLLTLLVVAALQMIALRNTGAWLIYENNDLKHFVLNLFFASNWGLQDGYSFNGPIWSVSAEILIYAFFWLVLPLLFVRGVLAPVVVTIGFLAVSLATSSTIAMCGYFYFLGVSIYVVHAQFRDRRWLQVLAAALLAATAFANLGLASRPSVSVVVLPGLFGALVLLLAAFEGEVSRRWARPLSWIGDSTYGVYLWHIPVQIIILLMLPVLGISRDVAYSPWFLLFFIATMLLIARLSFHFVERPARETIRRRLGGRRRPDPAIAAP